MLGKNNERYKVEKKFIFYNDMSGMLPELKEDFEWLQESNSQTLQTILKSLDASMKHYFKNKETVGFPKFKSKHSVKQGFAVPQHFSLEEKTFKIPKIGNIRYKKHREIYGTPKRLHITRDINDWFVSVVCEVPDSPELLELAGSLGIDLGIKDFAVTSEAEIIDAPNYKKLIKAVARWNRNLARKEKGSHNFQKTRDQLARKHRKIRRKRTDFMHKQTSMITKFSDVVSVENLNIKGMVQNRNLARSISEQGWGQFKVLLKQKLDRKGGQLVMIDQFFPSTKTCSCCGWIQKMPLSVRVYDCGNCGVQIPRDLNAAYNIRNEGERKIRSVRPELKLVESHGENQCAGNGINSSRLYEARSS